MFDRLLRHQLLTAPRRRRPAPLAASLLGLRPPRGLHPDPAGLRHRLRRSCRSSRGSRSSATRRWSTRRLAIAFLAFGVWAHHMFTTGLGPDRRHRSSPSRTMLIAIPTGVKIFNWIGTMWGGSVKLHDADALRGRLRLDVHHRRLSAASCTPRRRSTLQHNDSYFVVAHFHYVLFGGTIFGLFAGDLLLVPEVHRPDDGREAGQVALLADLHRLQRDLLPDALPRRRRHAAPHLHLPGPAPAGTSGTWSRRSARSCSAPRSGSSSCNVFYAPAARRAGRQRSVGRRDAGVGDPLAAAGLQLRQSADDHRARRLWVEKRAHEAAEKLGCQYGRRSPFARSRNPEGPYAEHLLLAHGGRRRWSDDLQRLPDALLPRLRADDHRPWHHRADRSAIFGWSYEPAGYETIRGRCGSWAVQSAGPLPTAYCSLPTRARGERGDSDSPVTARCSNRPTATVRGHGDDHGHEEHHASMGVNSRQAADVDVPGVGLYALRLADRDVPRLRGITGSGRARTRSSTSRTPPSAPSCC